MEGKYYHNKNLYLNGSVTYQKSKNDDVENLAPVADMAVKAGVSYMWDNGLTLGLFDIYQGDLADRFEGNLNSNQGAYNLLHLHSALNVNKMFNLSSNVNFTAILNVDNLLDKEHFGYDLGGTSGDGIPAFPGRRIYLGLNVGL